MAVGGALASLRRRAERSSPGFGFVDRHAWPDFLIIGAQKSGTTSLWRYLASHPDVVAARRKEMHLFDRPVTRRGLRQYRLGFPRVTELEPRALDEGRGEVHRMLTFEATPSYLFVPDAGRRCRGVLPAAKFLVLLRDPVERAWSHWRMEVRKGRESLTFDEALGAEPERLERAVETQDLRSHLSYSYASRGLYADQLERWFVHFPRAQFFVVRSDELFSRPADTYVRILDFLGLDSHLPDFSIRRPVEGRATEGPMRGAAGEVSLDPGLESSLRSRFHRPNARLSELVGIDFNEI